MDAQTALSKVESQDVFLLRKAISKVEEGCHDANDQVRQSLVFVIAMAICYVDSIDGTDTMED